jgi:2-oxo-3-hexenedioate decarboxylase
MSPITRRRFIHDYAAVGVSIAVVPRFAFGQAQPSDGVVQITADMATAEALQILGTPRTITPFTTRDPTFDLTRAYKVEDRVHAVRVARSESPVGRKIGFTNRKIWDEFGVREPIWGFVYNTTLSSARDGHATASIGVFPEPRIEPEILLHFKSAPPVTQDEDAILDSIDWIAHGFEIVQSPFPAWKFKVADTVAVNGLHAHLVVGKRVPVVSIADCRDRLRTFRVALKKGANVVAEGSGANVLGSPLLALGHLTSMLARLPEFPPVAAGETVTTGTLTPPMPIKPGETWSTELSGIDLPGLSITFTT